jgi:hypothetical protein
LGPLTHPAVIKQDRAADRFVFNHHFGGLEHPDCWRSRLRWRRDQLLRAPQWLLKKIKSLV